jgi:hypothetical protein
MFRVSWLLRPVVARNVIAAMRGLLDEDCDGLVSVVDTDTPTEISGVSLLPKLHILIADDTPLNVKVLKAMLRRLGHTGGTCHVVDVCVYSRVHLIIGLQSTLRWTGSKHSIWRPLLTMT